MEEQTISLPPSTRPALFGLPPEVRLMIWRYCLPLQSTLILEMDLEKNQPIFKYEGYVQRENRERRKDVPIPLFICQESRNEAEKYYRVVIYPLSHTCHICMSVHTRRKTQTSYVERISSSTTFFDISKEIIFMSALQLAIFDKDINVGDLRYLDSDLRLFREERAQHLIAILEKIRFLAISEDEKYAWDPSSLPTLLARCQNLEQLLISVDSPSYVTVPFNIGDKKVGDWYFAMLEESRPFKMEIHQAWAKTFKDGVEQPPLEREEGFEYYLRLKRELGIPLLMIKSMTEDHIRHEVGLPYHS